MRIIDVWEIGWSRCLRTSKTTLFTSIVYGSSHCDVLQFLLQQGSFVRFLNPMFIIQVLERNRHWRSPSPRFGHGRGRRTAGTATEFWRREPRPRSDDGCLNDRTSGIFLGLLLIATRISTVKSNEKSICFSCESVIARSLPLTFDAYRFLSFRKFGSFLLLFESAVCLSILKVGCSRKGCSLAINWLIVSFNLSKAMWWSVTGPLTQEMQTQGNGCCSVWNPLPRDAHKSQFWNLKNRFRLLGIFSGLQWRVQQSKNWKCLVLITFVFKCLSKAFDCVHCVPW